MPSTSSDKTGPVKKAAVVLNGFVHDFSTGYWLSAIIAIRMLHRFAQGNPLLGPLLNDVQRFFFWSSIIAVVIILLTGIGRTYTYADNIFGGDVESVRRRLLIAKHVILFIVFGAGGWWAYSMTFC